MVVKWVPDHVRINSNKEADKLAKRAVKEGVLNVRLVMSGNSKEDTDQGELEDRRKCLAETNICLLGESLCNQADFVAVTWPFWSFLPR